MNGANPKTTKTRILTATAELFRRQGYVGTGLKQIALAAPAPFGSLYHFFPGGKAQLGEEVIRTAGAQYGLLIGLFFGPSLDVATSLENFFDGAAETLVQTNFADACPIATIALEVASTDETLRIATADVFRSWIEELAAHLCAAGLPREPSQALAAAAVSMLEGAFVLARATQDAGYVRQAGRIMAQSVRRALLDFGATRVADGAGAAM